MDVPRRRVTLLLSERTRGVKESASESSCIRLKAEARCASEHTGLNMRMDAVPSFRHLLYTRVLSRAEKIAHCPAKLFQE